MTKLATALLPLAFLPACSCDGDTETGSGGGSSTNTAAGGASGSGGNTSSTSTFGPGSTGSGGADCMVGTPCNDGAGVCTAGDVCCPAAQACNDACCALGDACSFGACVVPGVDCTDSTECPTGEYCEHSLGVPLPPPGPGCIAGAPVSTGKCLPNPPACAPGTEPDPENLTCVATCELVPQFPTFQATLKYSWGNQVTSPFSTDVMMTPVVISLDDDDCDGKVTARDIPEIVFSTFTSGAYGGAGVLHAISVLNGVVTDKWTATEVHPTKQLAAGNVDGVAGNEIVGCTQAGAVRAWNGADGTVLWTSAAMSCFMPSIADLDQDGAPEVVVEGGILNGATGALKASYSEALDSSFVVSDVDGDGFLDIVTGSRIYHADGAKVADTGVANVSSFYATQDWKSPWPAVGDFDLDGDPEIVVVDNVNHQLRVWRYDATSGTKTMMLRGPVDLNATIPPSACAVGTWGNTHGGGPPTIADFTGDGVPDVATAGGVGYVVFDGAQLLDPMVLDADTPAWIKPTVDCSSASTGSTVFDFNGDGVSEVVYGDQQEVRIYDGPTGNILFEACNTTATLIENPVVADVDNDGQADIVAVANAYASGSAGTQCNDGVANGQSGIRIYGSADDTWVRTRRIWNQHAYHVTNVSEDGAIPAVELENWTQPGLNDFRQNKQPGSEFAAPDAVVTVAPQCGNTYALVATVRNIGQAVLPPGAVVTFFEGAPPTGNQLGQLSTTSALFPAEAEVLVLDVAPALGNTTIYASVTSPSPECRTDNDQSATVSAQCGVPQ